MSNLWSGFYRILPKDRMLVGKVVAFEGTRSRVEYPDGSTSLVRGQDFPVGTYVFIQTGAIVGEAPEAMPVTLEV